MKRLILFVLLAATFASCGGASVGGKAHYPNAITPEAQARFDSADALYRSRRFAEADAAFEKIIAGLPYTQLTDESRFRRGEIAFINKDYNRALSFYNESVAQIASPSIAPKAMFKAALSLNNLNRPKDALDQLQKINRKDASAILRLRADSLGVKASKGSAIAPNASMAWQLFLLDDYSEAQGVTPSGISPDELVTEDAALKEVRRWMSDNAVSAADIEALPLKEMKGRRSGGFASYKLALAYHSAGDAKAATRQLKSYLSTYPKHEYYGSARLLMGELGGAVGEGAGVTVGVVLPLSGKYAVYGESALHGIECAVGTFEPCQGPAGMKLVIKDSESTSGGAAGAVSELAAENVEAIVGPLLSAGASEAAKRAQELSIPIISLSQREDVSGATDDYVFRNSVSDSSEMSTLADYAVNKLHLKRFFILHPMKSKKAEEYKNLFIEAVKSQGGVIAGTKTYSQGQMAELGDELRGRGSQEFGRQIQDEKGQEISTGGANFDALFIPDSMPAAIFMVQHLALSGDVKFKLLGISRWDDQKFVDRAAGYANGSLFVDSFYKGAPDEHVANFVSRFRQAYGAEPTLLEALGYDAMRLIISAVQEKGAVHRDSIRNAIARTSNFPGVTGKISFNSGGNAERQLWVLTVKDGAIEPAK